MRMRPGDQQHVAPAGRGADASFPSRVVEADAWFGTRWWEVVMAGGFVPVPDWFGWENQDCGVAVADVDGDG